MPRIHNWSNVEYYLNEANWTPSQRTTYEIKKRTYNFDKDGVNTDIRSDYVIIEFDTKKKAEECLKRINGCVNTEVTIDKSLEAEKTHTCLVNILRSLVINIPGCLRSRRLRESLWALKASSMATSV